jgi:hypothetical protein
MGHVSMDLIPPLRHPPPPLTWLSFPPWSDRYPPLGRFAGGGKTIGRGAEAPGHPTPRGEGPREVRELPMGGLFPP